jgi:hypothetical protein
MIYVQLFREWEINIRFITIQFIYIYIVCNILQFTYSYNIFIYSICIQYKF